MKKFINFTLDILPLLSFFITNMKTDIVTATIALIVTSIICLSISYIINGVIPKTPLITVLFICIFGGLTVILNDENFIKIKPTIINLFFAGTLGLGLFIDKIFLKTILDSAFHISDTGWRILTRLWIFFFLFLATLNELARRMLSTDNWVNFKVFGILAITLVFSLTIIPIIKKHAKKEE